MTTKIRVGVLFGGRSGEHEVSLVSAASVMQAMDAAKFEVVPVGITKKGEWLSQADSRKLLNGTLKGRVKKLSPSEALGKARAAIVFPVLHGTFGEDGTMQGLLELEGAAYVGSGVLGSSAGMDKDAAKRIFRDAGLPQVKSVTIWRADWEKSPAKAISQISGTLKFPVFVKPANLGSSVGISKAHDSSELPAALKEAALYDRKIVVEQGVGGKKYKAREVECAVLGNHNPKASVCGEIVPAAEFYDYDAKYADAASELLIPARLTKAQQKQIQQMAIAAFQSLDCAGLARVDFLVEPVSGKVYLNEVNTMPGFTAISMYPKLWAASGLDYTSLITRLIELGLERAAENRRNRYSKA
jgi:D-alanine-D-alanine ligase